MEKTVTDFEVALATAAELERLNLARFEEVKLRGRLQTEITCLRALAIREEAVQGEETGGCVPLGGNQKQESNP